MTELEWLSCTNPHAMLRYLEEKLDALEERAEAAGSELYPSPSELAELVETEEGKRFAHQARGVHRKVLDHFPIACCRRLGPLLVDARSWRALDSQDLFADRLLSDDAYKQMIRDAADAANEFGAYTAEGEAASAVYRAVDPIEDRFKDLQEVLDHVEQAVWRAHETRGGDYAPPDEPTCQANLLRDIFGNPFRPVELPPAWLTANVVALARTIYDERALPSGLFDNQRMGVLADALEEAGCDNAAVLDHCRQPGEHVRGCWVVDQVLGKA